MKKIGLLILMLVGLFILPAFAEEIPSFDMEQIIVQSSLLAQDNSLNISNINTKVVKPGKATNLADLLKDVAGIDVQQRTIAGDTQDTVKLRGFDGKRFTVLLDGRTINAAGVMGGYYVDWGTIPLEIVEKIEIIKGPKSAHYGNTLGGVINIITKKQINQPVTHLQAGGGSYGFKNYRLDHSGNAGALSYILTAGKKEADGYLRNNYLDSKDVALNLNYTFANKGQLSVGMNRVETERGFIVNNRMNNNPNSLDYNKPKDGSYPAADGDSLSPSVSNPITDGSYWNKINKYYTISYSQPLANGQWKVNYYKNDEKRDEYIYDNNKNLALQRSITADKSYSWLAEIEQKIADKHNLVYGYEEKQLCYGDDITNFPAYKHGYPSQKMKIMSGYLEDKWQVNEKTGLNLGLRYDKYEGRPDQNSTIKNIDGNAISPKFNLSYQLSNKSKAYFSVNRAYRTPSMAEFYWWSLYNNPSGFMLNPPFSVIGSKYSKQDLRAEDGYAYELGFQTTKEQKANYKVNFYYNDIKDYINFEHTIAPVRPAYNIDKVKIWGAELETEQKLQENLTLFSNYTYQRTKKAGNLETLTPWDQMSSKLDYRPEHKANIGLRYKTEKGTELALSERYTGTQQAAYFFANAVPFGPATNYCQLIKLPSYWVTDISITHPIGKDKELSFYVDNLFDKNYEEKFGYPMPGVTYGINYKMQF